jgi:hypothetical protein
MRVHTDEAWEVASHFSNVLASDTRTLAAMIDNLVDAKIEEAAGAGFIACDETGQSKLGKTVYLKICSLKRNTR